MIGGVILVVLGLNLAGILAIPASPSRGGRSTPGAASSVATATGTMSLASAGAGATGGPTFSDRVGGRLVELARRLARVLRARGDLRRRLDALHRDHPRRHPRAGLVVADRRPGRGPAVAYTLGLGIPFLLIAVLYDRAPALLRPLIRHGRAVSIIGGLLVVAIGVAMIMDWLALLPRWFNFAGV